MKSILRHSVLILLILSIVSGSVGADFSEQLCLMPKLKQGNTTGQADYCCTSEKQQGKTKTEDNCCTVKVSYFKLDTVSIGGLFKLQPPVYFSHKSFLDSLQANFTPTPQQVYTYTDGSPPLHGRELLHRLHTLIV